MRSTTLNRLAPDLEALVRAETLAVQAGPRASADEVVLAEVRRAVLAGQPLGFIYSRPGAEARRRVMTPCGLMFGRANYLVAAEPDGGAIKTFRLDRMSAVKAEPGVATPPADFDLQVFAGQSFGIYQDAIEDVVLKITPEGRRRPGAGAGTRPRTSRTSRTARSWSASAPRACANWPGTCSPGASRWRSSSRPG